MSRSAIAVTTAAAKPSPSGALHCRRCCDRTDGLRDLDAGAASNLCLCAPSSRSTAGNETKVRAAWPVSLAQLDWNANAPRSLLSRACGVTVSMRAFHSYGLARGRGSIPLVRNALLLAAARTSSASLQSELGSRCGSSFFRSSKVLVARAALVSASPAQESGEAARAVPPLGPSSDARGSSRTLLSLTGRSLVLVSSSG